jgi:hypothetical protein
MFPTFRCARSTGGGALTLVAVLAAGCLRPVMEGRRVAEEEETGDPLGGCGVGDLPTARMWRLTQSQLRNSLQDLFGFSAVAVESLPADSRLEGFANRAEGLGVPPLLMDHYNTISEEMAAGAVRRSGQLLPCPLDRLGKGSCLRDFLGRFGRRVWRRPLSDAEVGRLSGVYRAVAETTEPGNGLRVLIKALLLSPNFLFRSELGAGPGPDGIIRLNDFELAAELSYLLWDSTPDEVLLELAAAGRLREPAVRRAQAARMLASSRRAAPPFASFVRQWLKIEDLPRIRKDRKQFPMYRELSGDLLEENRRFVDSVAFDPGGDRRLRTLLTAPYAFTNTRTAVLYGVGATVRPAPAVAAARADSEPDDDQEPDEGKERREAKEPKEPIDKIGPLGLANDGQGGARQPTLSAEALALRATPLDPAERRGILTQVAFLSAHAGPETPNLVARGSFVREQLLCGEVPEPPDDFKFDDAKITDDMTAREKFTLHTRNPFCANCHALFDNIGFALESYDAIGRFRRTDKGKPLDTTGTVKVPGRPDLRFTSFVDLMDQLADLPETSDCFSLQYLTYATGRRAADVSACEKKSLARAFAASGYRLDGLMAAVAGSPGFALRRP